ncbi:MAG: AzlD domain-containing protein [Hyphomicrobiaceae bacterium]
MRLEWANLLAFFAMGVATYATRLGGLWLVAALRPSRTVKAALDAVPVAVLTAVIAPEIVKGGPPDLIAAALTLLAAFRLPLLAAVALGVAAAVALRAVMA